MNKSILKRKIKNKILQKSLKKRSYIRLRVISIKLMKILYITKSILVQGKVVDPSLFKNKVITFQLGFISEDPRKETLTIASSLPSKEDKRLMNGLVKLQVP